MIGMVPVLGSDLGKIFAPLFEATAWLMAFFYAAIPNYAVAIGLVTVAVMIVTAPLTIKSTRSMMAMQRLSPELKKLQQKYKGDRQKLNEEMMNLYKEHGVNPAGGCLPMLIQFPVFIVLYDTIKGLTNTATVKVHGHKVLEALPRYISHHTRLYRDLVHSPGKMEAFGINLAQRFLGEFHYGVVHALPFGVLILIAIGLQYWQMRQLNRRNQAFAQANPQAQMMQRYMPLIFAVIYINISAGVNVYFIVSSLCRMGLQLAAFRAGPADAAKRAAEARLPGAGGTARRKGFMERLADMQKQALEAQQARQAALQAGTPTEGTGNGSRPPAGTKGSGGPRNGSRARPPASAAQPPTPPAHPRSRAKRARKAR